MVPVYHLGIPWLMSLVEIIMMWRWSCFSLLHPTHLSIICIRLLSLLISCTSFSTCDPFKVQQHIGLNVCWAWGLLTGHASCKCMIQGVSSNLCLGYVWGWVYLGTMNWNLGLWYLHYFYLFLCSLVTHTRLISLCVNQKLTKMYFCQNVSNSNHVAHHYHVYGVIDGMYGWHL